MIWFDYLSSSSYIEFSEDRESLPYTTVPHRIGIKTWEEEDDDNDGDDDGESKLESELVRFKFCNLGPFWWILFPASKSSAVHPNCCKQFKCTHNGIRFTARNAPKIFLVSIERWMLFRMSSNKMKYSSLASSDELFLKLWKESDKIWSSCDKKCG